MKHKRLRSLCEAASMIAGVGLAVALASFLFSLCKDWSHGHLKGTYHYGESLLFVALPFAFCLVASFFVVRTFCQNDKNR
jgi:hypothetical protein